LLVMQNIPSECGSVNSPTGNKDEVEIVSTCSSSDECKLSCHSMAIV